MHIRFFFYSVDILCLWSILNILNLACLKRINLQLFQKWPRLCAAATSEPDGFHKGSIQREPWRWKEPNSQVLHNVQSLMPRPWSPFKTWRIIFLVGQCIIWIIMIMGSYRKQGCPLSQFCVFLFRPLFSLLHFLSCPDLLFQIGFPFHNCETKPYAPHTQNRNQRKKSKGFWRKSWT